MNCKDLRPAMDAGRDMRQKLKELIPQLRECPNKDALREAFERVTQALDLLARVHVTLD
jgi:flagellar biosynthesis/type III secretory pathway chaperone